MHSETCWHQTLHIAIQVIQNGKLNGKHEISLCRAARSLLSLVPRSDFQDGWVLLKDAQRDSFDVLPQLSV